MLEARQEAEELYKRVLSLESLERGPKWEMLLRTSVDEICDALRRTMFIAGCFQSLGEIVGLNNKLITNEMKEQIHAFRTILIALRESPSLTAMTEELGDVDIVKMLVDVAGQVRNMLKELESAHTSIMKDLKTILDEAGDASGNLILFEQIEFLTTKHPEMVCHVSDIWSDEEVGRKIGLLAALYIWINEIGETDEDPIDLAEDFVDGLAVYDRIDEEDESWGKVKRELRL